MRYKHPSRWYWILNNGNEKKSSFDYPNRSSVHFPFICLCRLRYAHFNSFNIFLFLIFHPLAATNKTLDTITGPKRIEMKWNHYTTKSTDDFFLFDCDTWNDSFVPFYSTCLKSICSYFQVSNVFFFFFTFFSHCLHRFISIIIWSLDLFFPNINKFLRWLFSQFLVISFASVHFEMRNVMIAMVVAMLRTDRRFPLFAFWQKFCWIHYRDLRLFVIFIFQIYSHGQK